MRALRSAGRAVLLTTHYLEEADALADRIVVLDRGLIAADDTPQALRGGASLEDAFLAITGHGMTEASA